MTTKQRVLLLGATGETGRSILQGLLEDGESFEVEVLVRPSSTTKPAVKALAERGVNIRVADITGPIEDLVKVLSGIDVLISVIDAGSQLAQIQLATAAKEAGVKRFIPCAFITVAPPGGVMALRDSKEQVYQHIRKLYLPHTIIDVGFWYQISFPTVPSGRADYTAIIKPNAAIHGDGKTPTILIDREDIGRFVARIVKDNRTLNKSVIAYGDVLSENEVFGTMERLSGEKIERQYVSRAIRCDFRTQRFQISTDDIMSARAETAAAAKADPTNTFAGMMAWLQDYNYSKYVRGDNTLAHATYLGYLDARELYPDFQPKGFEHFVRDVLDGKGEKRQAISLR
ncbi:hypothetical protein C8F04DRAFT_1342400 [Mycena alexandri]|uniref:NmrA-like domain-containing protein n=1 Tax=Mycena alexandri TaxID=1745969 RepID=A0AAD6SWU6_9AGAR|nr:hypothetical protein C8F04DRAFT_1342400 [Mycena alexandri]